MSAGTMILTAILLLWITVRTVSYAVWNWKSKNKYGAFMIILVCLGIWALPIYMLFFRS